MFVNAWRVPNGSSVKQCLKTLDTWPFHNTCWKFCNFPQIAIPWGIKNGKRYNTNRVTVFLVDTSHHWVSYDNTSLQDTILCSVTKNSQVQRESLLACEAQTAFAECLQSLNSLSTSTISLVVTVYVKHVFWFLALCWHILDLPLLNTNSESVHQC